MIGRTQDLTFRRVVLRRHFIACVPAVDGGGGRRRRRRLKNGSTK